MAFERCHSRSSSSGILPSSISCLDGVPFKIGIKFKPPLRLLCIDEIKKRPRCPALDEEYVFETEEGVLAWAEARAKAQEEQKKQIESKQLNTNVNNSDTDSSTEDNCDVLVNSTKLGENQTSASPVAHLDEPKAQSQPVAAAMSADILKPVPITSSKIKPPHVNSQVLDLALFEKEEDLFDNIDRQMINEMEELKTVLQPLQSSNDANFSCNSNVDENQNNDAEALTGVSHTNDNSSDQCNGVADLNCDKDSSVPRPVEPEQDIVESDTVAVEPQPVAVKPIPAVRKSKLPPKVICAEGDYVELRKDFSSSSVFFSKVGTQTDSKGVNNSVVANALSNKQSITYSEDIGVHKANMNNIKGTNSIQKDSSSDLDGGSVLGGNLPPHMANSGVFKPVLPPIQSTLPPIQPAPPPKPARPAPPPPYSVSAKTAKKDSLVESLPPIKPTQQIVSSDIGKHSASEEKPVASARFSYIGSSTPAVGMENKYSRYSGSFTSSDGERDSSSPARSSSSNSDITHSSPSKQVNSRVPVSMTPPPRPSSEQNLMSVSASPLWNPYQPLPTRKPGSCESSSPDLCSPSEFDPYLALSEREQKFVNSLTAMGFSRPLVGRAVTKLGTNEREVLDYLDNVDKLSEKGFSAVLSETALQLFDNNSKKAEEYLTLYSQFQELGFRGEKIKDALVKENLDRDKALDVLTSC